MQEGQVKRVIFSPKIIVLALVVVLLIIGTVVYHRYRADVARRPETYGASYMQFLTEKDGSTTYSAFNEQAKKRISADDWNSWVVFAFDKYDGGKPKLIKKDTVPDPGHDYSKNDSVVRLRYQIQTNGKTGQLNLLLAQDGDTWRVAEASLVQ